MQKNKLSNKLNIIILLAGLVLYAAGLASIVSVFVNAYSFPFFVSERFTLGGEINLIIGVVLFVLSQVFYLFFYEKSQRVLNISRKNIFLYSLFGPLSSIIILRKHKSNLSQREEVSFFVKSTKPVSMTNMITGGIIFIGALSFLIVLLFRTVSFESYPRKCSASQMSDNERKAYHRLIQIYNAQKQYIKRDWDKDGIFSYSLFLVNLWQTLDENVFPIEINLIPKELGYAMRRAHSLDGYFYVDIHCRNFGKDPDDSSIMHKVALNHSNEFAVVSFPEQYGETGRLSFIIDQTGTVKCFELSTIADDYSVGNFVLPFPEDFEKWRQLSSEDDLMDFQAKIITQ